MVSNTRLTQIHLRLAQIFAQCDSTMEEFGGVNMLLLGDLLQVSKNPLFHYFITKKMYLWFNS